MVHKGGSIKRYTKLWWSLVILSLQRISTSRFAVLFFISAKLFRFLSFLFFLLLLHAQKTALAGYSGWEVTLFFATFTFIDTLSQVFLRDVYNFRPKIEKGEFDFFLLQPFSPLFRSLFGSTDILDLPVLFLTIVLIGISISQQVSFSFVSVMLYILLLLNGLLIAVSLHIFILCVGLVNASADQLLWLYRDISLLGRLPVELYKAPFREIITYIIPIGIMVNFPPEALLGLLHPLTIVTAFLIGSILFLASILTWRHMLRFYSSASS